MTAAVGGPRSTDEVKAHAFRCAVGAFFPADVLSSAGGLRNSKSSLITRLSVVCSPPRGRRLCRYLSLLHAAAPRPALDAAVDEAFGGARADAHADPGMAAEAATGAWSASEDVTFEAALAHVPESDPARWAKVENMGNNSTRCTARTPWLLPHRNT